MRVPTPNDVELERQEAIKRFAKMALATRIDEKIIKILFSNIDKETLTTKLYITHHTSVPNATVYAFIDEHIVDRIRDAGWHIVVNQNYVFPQEYKNSSHQIVHIAESNVNNPTSPKTRAAYVLAMSKPPTNTTHTSSTVRLFRQGVCVHCITQSPHDRYAMTCGHVNYCIDCAENPTIQSLTRCAICRRPATLVRTM